MRSYRVSESFLRDATRRIVQALRPHKVILFGSHAYGKPGPDSDVDLLIIAPTRQRFAQRYVAASRLFEPRRYPMDFVVLTPREVRRRLAGVEPFLREALTRGRVLYAADT